MGRRSTSTTKGGRFMNPTDQARKEARKKELKKNKKQRKIVREAVLRSRNPKNLLEEIEKLEQQELEASLIATPNDKSLKEKRRKLKECFDKTIKLFEKEDPERYNEYKRMELEHEQRRKKTIYCYESKRKAMAVLLDDIPLPDAVPDNDTLSDDIPLPEEDYEPSELPIDPNPTVANEKGNDADDPDNSDEDDQSVDNDSSDSLSQSDDNSSHKIHSNSVAGQLGKVMEGPDSKAAKLNENNSVNAQTVVAGPASHFIPMPRAPFVSQAPPGIPNRLPPGPPPGPPPSMLRPVIPPPIPTFIRNSQPLNISLQASQLSKISDADGSDETSMDHSSKKNPTSATISAKPQLRSNASEVKKFVPLSLLVRRDQVIKQQAVKPKMHTGTPSVPVTSSHQSSKKNPTKFSTDVAYADFMKEIKGLL